MFWSPRPICLILLPVHKKRFFDSTSFMISTSFAVISTKTAGVKKIINVQNNMVTIVTASNETEV